MWLKFDPPMQKHNLGETKQYLLDFELLPCRKPWYHFCKDPNCVLYAKKYILDASIFPHSGMKFVYNHASFHSKLILELKRKINYFGGDFNWYKKKEMTWFKMEGRFPLVTVPPTETVKFIEVPHTMVTFVDDKIVEVTKYVTKKHQVFNINDEEKGSYPPIRRPLHLYKTKEMKDHMFRAEFVQRAVFIHSIVFHLIHEKCLFKGGTDDDWNILLNFNDPLLRIRRNNGLI
jgi:hypothetical protein